MSEDPIEAYIKSKELLSESRIKAIKQVLNRTREAGMLEKDEADILKWIKDLGLADSTVNKYVNILVGWLKYREIPITVMGESICKFKQVNTVVQNNKTKEECMHLKELVSKWNNIEDKKDKLLLGMLLFSMSPRSDLVFIRCDIEVDSYIDYTNNTVVYSKQLKSKRLGKDKYEGEKLVMDIPIELLALIREREGKDYLIEYEGESRHNFLPMKVQRLTKKYFDRKLGINDIRRIRENSGNIGATPEQQLENAKRNGHTIGVAKAVYQRVVEKSVEEKLLELLELEAEIDIVEKRVGNFNIILKRIE